MRAQSQAGPQVGPEVSDCAVASLSGASPGAGGDGGAYGGGGAGSWDAVDEGRGAADGGCAGGGCAGGGASSAGGGSGGKAFVPSSALAIAGIRRKRAAPTSIPQWKYRIRLHSRRKRTRRNAKWIERSLCDAAEDRSAGPPRARSALRWTAPRTTSSDSSRFFSVRGCSPPELPRTMRGSREGSGLRDCLP